MRSFVMAAALTVAGAAAFGQDVRVDFDKDANFAGIKTFHAQIGTKWGNPLGEDRVLEEVEQALVERGWAKTSRDAADALVVLHGATETQKSLNELPVAVRDEIRDYAKARLVALGWPSKQAA